MRTAYFDCFSGISGDMCLGALIDAGVPLGEIQRGLRGLRLRGYRLRAEKVTRSAIAATKVDVVLTATRRSPARKWKDVRDIIENARLPEEIRQRGKKIFRTLFAAEAAVHGKTIKGVHLHELGAVDCLVDVFGTLIALAHLGVERVFASPVNLGSGTVRTEHGALPVPAPATIDLLRGVPVYTAGGGGELTTPTGAAILAGLTSTFGPMPSIIPDRIGHGAGSRDEKGMPNVLRVLVGEQPGPESGETVSVVETNIDDMNPQIYGYLMDRLFAAGALDVFLTQVLMKKTRPGVLLTVLCSPDKKGEIMEVIFRESTTIGIRHYEAARTVLDRSMVSVKTRYGKIPFKVSRPGSVLERESPEFDDCRKIAEETGRPLWEIMEQARKDAGSRRRK